MHFLRSGVRSSPFGAALTAACVNFVVAAAVAADALPTGTFPFFGRGVSVFPPDSIFAWLSPTLSSSIEFVTKESENPSESVSSPRVPVLH